MLEMKKASGCQKNEGSGQIRDRQTELYGFKIELMKVILLHVSQEHSKELKPMFLEEGRRTWYRPLSFYIYLSLICDPYKRRESFLVEFQEIRCSDLSLCCCSHYLREPASSV